MNPLVNINSKRGSLQQLLTSDALASYDLVISSQASFVAIKTIDDYCSSRGILYFNVDTRGWFGWAFANLGSHKWILEVRIVLG